LKPTSDDLLELYRRLFAVHGPRNWWPVTGGGRFEIICGAVLTQNTRWRNAEDSLANMKAAGLWSFRSLHIADPELLAEAIRPSGYYNTKARKLKTFAAVVEDEFGGSLDAMFDRTVEELRGLLLGIWGIGEETADDIVLYAAEKPTFVIDRYTTRLVDRLGWQVEGNRRYGDYKKMFEDLLPADVPLFNEFHAVIDGHGARTCTSRAPACGGCCLLDICPTGQNRVATV
jgi:endonuclease-3 related protein